MNILNFEFKARVDDLDKYESKLLALDPLFQGEDHQVDTYFNVPGGRLKLREGIIEHALIHYDREDIAGSKRSDVILYKHQPDPALKDILVRQLGVRITVEKRRRIYFLDNVKFHFDRVEGLGEFLEVEVIDDQGEFTVEQLKKQCDHYLEFFHLDSTCLVDRSYCELTEDKQR